MGSSSVRRPADLDIVRESYDRVADNYVDMVATTGLGDIRTHPWLKAAMDVFADAVGGLGPVLDVGCGPGTVTAYLARTEAYGGVAVNWTTYQWQPDQLAALVEQAGLRSVAQLRLPAEGPIGPVVVLVGRRDH